MISAIPLFYQTGHRVSLPVTMRYLSKPILLGHTTSDHLPKTVEPPKSKNPMVRFFQRLGDWVKNFFVSAWLDIKQLFKMDPPHLHGDGTLCHDANHVHEVAKPSTVSKSHSTRRTGFSMRHLSKEDDSLSDDGQHHPDCHH